MAYFSFSQVEVAWPLGPPDGRYLIRASGAGAESPTTHVLIIATVGAIRRQSRLRRRHVRARPEPEPTRVPIGRATLISTLQPAPDAAAAARWLAAAGEAELAADLRILEQALHAFRVVSADPYSEPPARERLLVARIGYGQGEEVADGRWSRARELLPVATSRRRSRVLEPQARFAAVLGGRVPVLVCEELALRARRDLDAGRHREAALQLRIAVDAALSELGADDLLAAPLRQLGEARATLADTGAAALTRALHEAERAQLATTLTTLEALLRARAASLS